jgi:hypothetical protein
VLATAPDAGGYVGPGWFGALVAAARQAVPGARFFAFLDCGNKVGAALAAIRAGIEGVVFIGRPDVAQRLADIAHQHGVRLETSRPAPALDLTEEFFTSPHDVERRCGEYLRGSTFGRGDSPDAAAGQQHLDCEGRNSPDRADDRQSEGCNQHRGDG